MAGQRSADEAAAALEQLADQVTAASGAFVASIEKQTTEIVTALKTTAKAIRELGQAIDRPMTPPAPPA